LIGAGNFTGDAVLRVTGGAGLDSVEELMGIIVGTLRDGVGALHDGMRCSCVDGEGPEGGSKRFLPGGRVLSEVEAVGAHSHRVLLDFFFDCLFDIFARLCHLNLRNGATLYLGQGVVEEMSFRALAFLLEEAFGGGLGLCSLAARSVGG
jgi:hypothetical protein